MSKLRDPVQGEFFNTDTIKDPASKITREGIGQNPMDATVEKGGLARVRVYASEAGAALPPSVARPYFSGLVPHVEASSPRAAQAFDEHCQYFVVEDFGTKGLIGDIHATREPAGGEENHFFYFVRAEGKSGKSGTDIGRWGIGKYVFPDSGAINTFFALTVRHDGPHPGPLLLGQAVLKNHSIGDDDFQPDGYWAELDASGVPIPTSDASIIDEFRDTWKVSRRDEPGLSVVVPYAWDGLTGSGLVKAICSEYFIAILDRRLEVTVSAPSLSADVEITATTLRAVVRGHFEPDEADSLLANIELVDWYLARKREKEVTVELPPVGDPSWKSGYLDEDGQATLRTVLSTSGRAIVRVPVPVINKIANEETLSFFDVVLERVEQGQHRPVFVREGLLIPDVRSKSAPGHRTIVLVDDDELARMVGDSEGPAHVNWNSGTEQFKGKYAQGRNWLGFIKRAPESLLRLVRGDDEEVDHEVLADFFPVPGESKGTKKPSGGKPRGDDPKPPPPTPPESSPRKVSVYPITGGFRARVREDVPPYSRLSLAVGYNRRRGNPIKRWKPDDFRLTSGTFEVQSDGCDEVSVSENLIECRVLDAERFEISVIGFDVTRDLAVRDVLDEGTE